MASGFRPRGVRSAVCAGVLAASSLLALSRPHGQRPDLRLARRQREPGALGQGQGPVSQELQTCALDDRRRPFRTTRPLSKRAAEYQGLIEEHAALNTVNPDLVRAVIQAESAFNPRAVSPKGAMGLMQLMPATAAEFGVTDAFNPAQNIRAGVTYLKQLLDTYDGRVELALAAYNAGPGAVKKYGGKVPPYRETQNYVARIQGSTSSGDRRHERARWRRDAPSTGRCRSSTAARWCGTPQRQARTQKSSKPPSGDRRRVARADSSIRTCGRPPGRCPDDDSRPRRPRSGPGLPRRRRPEGRVEAIKAGEAPVPCSV